jgi:UDP-GlcNAc:undecaprenyl-phosphate GlcNAc-1-phosphate transferase
VSELTYQYRSYEVLLDMGLIALAYYGAYSIRFQEPEFSHFLEYFLRSFPLVIAIQTTAFAAAGKYRQVWRSFGSSETITILKGVAYGVSASVIATLYLFSFEGFSRIVYGLDAALLTFLMVGSRLVISQFDEYLRRQRGSGRKVLIYGAGRGGVLLLRELMQNAALNLQPVGFLDDAPAKRRLRVEGLPVLGPFADLGTIAERHGAAMVVISIQALAPAQLAAIHAACMAHGLHVRRMRFALDDLGPLEVRVSRHAG